MISFLAPGEPQGALRAAADQVASVEPAVLEGSFRRPRIVPVAREVAWRADDHLADDADAGGVSFGVDHSDVDARDGTAERIDPALRPEPIGGDMAGLGGAEDLMQRATDAGGELKLQVRRHGVAFLNDLSILRSGFAIEDVDVVDPDVSCAIVADIFILHELASLRFSVGVPSRRNAMTLFGRGRLLASSLREKLVSPSEQRFLKACLCVPCDST
jgi:hypothetical protein